MTIISDIKNKLVGMDDILSDFDEGKSLDSFDNSNGVQKTLLAHAIMKGNNDAVKCLLSEGASINIGDSNGNTAIYYATKECLGVINESNFGILKDIIFSGNVDDNLEKISDIKVKHTMFDYINLKKLEDQIPKRRKSPSNSVAVNKQNITKLDTIEEEKSSRSVGSI